jgi:hypothetical protein
MLKINSLQENNKRAGCMDLIDVNNVITSFDNYKNSPFDHCVIDNFLTNPDIIEDEFLDYNSKHWVEYNNIVQHKKVNCDWYLFPKNTYQLFAYLNSPTFVDQLSKLVGCKLYSDPGLHSGGWHMHSAGGSLNPHLDYSIHPKLSLQRKLNLIVYLSKDLKEEHGGHFGLWSGTDFPDTLVKEIAPKFNRAIIFDTTQNSWHGLSRKCTVPEGIYRKSLAIYYLTDCPKDIDTRSRALFGLVGDQKSMANEVNSCPHLITDKRMGNI